MREQQIDQDPVAAHRMAGLVVEGDYRDVTEVYVTSRGSRMIIPVMPQIRYKKEQAGFYRYVTRETVFWTTRSTLVRLLSQD